MNYFGCGCQHRNEGEESSSFSLEEVERIKSRQRGKDKIRFCTLSLANTGVIMESVSHVMLILACKTELLSPRALCM